MDRWVIFAIAHVRDGENLEYNRHKAGKLSWPTNTFNDVVDLTRHLIVHVLGTSTGYGGFPTLAIKRQVFWGKPVVRLAWPELTHLGSRTIDAIIQKALTNINPGHWINRDVLREQDPDLIITREPRQVCAIGSGLRDWKRSTLRMAAWALDCQLPTDRQSLPFVFRNSWPPGVPGQTPFNAVPSLSSREAWRTIQHKKDGANGLRKPARRPAATDPAG